MTPRTRQRIGSFEIHGILGSGGMGVVYRAVSTDGTVAALKVLSHGASEELLHRFERESKIRIEHPNVVRVLEADVAPEGTPYIAFELLEGESVEALLASAPLSIDEALDIGVQATRGLIAAHSRGLVHRDVKPANLFRCRDGTIKVLDFGIALTDPHSSRLTTTGMVMGTPSYLAPEQARGEADIDARVDIWGVGAVVYHALTGRPPYKRETALGTLVSLVMDPVEPLSEAAPHVPKTLAAVIQRALAKPKARRWPTAESFLNALEAASNDSDGPSDALPSAPPSIVPGERRVVADEQSARALRGRFDVREAGARLFELTEEHPDQPSSRPSFPLIGREVELAQIDRSVRATLEGVRATRLLVVGPPGIGKSRLVQEVAARFQGAAGRRIDIPVMFARGEHHRRRAAFSLLRSALETYAHGAALTRGWPRLRPEAPLEERQHAVLSLAAHAIADRQQATRCADFLGELLDVPMPASPTLSAARSDPQLMGDRLRLALLDYFTALLSEKPSALIVENLQWADAASADLLLDLFESLEDQPLLLAGTAVVGHEAAGLDVFSGPDAVRIEPQNLMPSDVAQLAEAITGVRPSQALVDALAKRTEGNPLFIEQILASVAEPEHLTSEAELPLPLSVEAAVQSRLDGLPFEERDTLKIAAVFGRPFYGDELEAIGGDANLLPALEARSLVFGRSRRGTPRGQVYTFRSDLIATVALRLLDQSARAGLHTRLADYLDAIHDTDAEEVARHYEAAQRPTLAAERYVRAAMHHARRGDSPRVLDCAERARALGVPPSVRHGLNLAEAEALQFLGRHEDQGTRLQAAIEEAVAPHERAAAQAERTKWLLREGRPAEAIVTAQAAVAAGREGDVADIHIMALGRLALAQIASGNLDEARATLKRVARHGGEVSVHVRALAAGWQGQLATQQGDLGGRIEAFERAVALYTEAGDVRRAAGASVNLADSYNRVGAHERAAAALREALEGCRRVGNRPMEGYALVNLGYALTESGRAREALEVLERGATLASTMKERRLTALAGIYRGRADLVLGPTTEAANRIDAVARDAEVAALLGQAASALTVSSMIRLAVGDPGGALERSGEALALRNRLGSVEEDEAEIFLAHARALSAAGDHAAARTCLSQGRIRLRSIAAGIRVADLRNSFLTAVAAHRELIEDNEIDPNERPSP